MRHPLRLILALSALALAGVTADAQTNQAAVTTIDRYSLILFAFDSDAPGPINQRIIDEYVVPDITPRSEITVVGYSDVVGQEPHNRALAERRARRVADGITRTVGRDGYGSLEITAATEEQAPYRYDLPEGRLLSRTVVITVKTEGNERGWVERNGAGATNDD